MKSFIVVCLLGLCASALGAQIIVSDSYDVANSGSGFGLDSGVNSGINPPTTRLTGSEAAGLLYIKMYGTKADSAHYITNNSELAIAPANNFSTLSLSSDGANPYDFGPAINSVSESPSSPGVYDLTITMANVSSGNQRFSFAISSVAGTAPNWDFGIQLYHANAGDSFYTLQKRIGSSASGIAAINAPIATVGTYPNAVSILIRVTDAGAESSVNYSSRVQVSVDGGNTWIYDTAMDAALPNGWRFSGASRYLFWDIAPSAGPVTYDNFSFTLNSVTNPPPPTNSEVILADSYDVADSGSGFALGSGVNSGINPPVTRLTGVAATNLYYFKAYGTKPDSCHYITNNDKLAVSLSSAGSSTFSFSSGNGVYDFAPALDTAAATPAKPLVYDLKIGMANATAAANQRCSFAISSASGQAGDWDFALQIYRSVTSDTAYTLQKRISQNACGLGSAINAVIGTVGTYPNEVNFLIRVTDAGAESGTFSSRIQVSADGGNTWIYDTATDTDLPNGWCFPGFTRYVFWDVAPGSGPITYDNFSLTSLSFTNVPGPTNPPLAIISTQLNTNGFAFTWLSQRDTNYSVLKCTNLSSPSWVLVTNTTGTGGNMTITTDPSQSAEFYKVAELVNSGITVSNVNAAQRAGTGLVDIYYDLADLYAGDASISVLVSTDGGQSYHAAAASFSGDVGNGISPGTARHIVWDVGADWSAISAANVRVKIVADRAPVGADMALVPGGTFNMGNTMSPDGLACEKPVHAVQVDAFYADRFEVTKGLWDAVAQWATNHGYNFDSPAVATATNLPVQQVSWYDAVKWCNARSEKEGLPPAYFTDNTWTTVYRTGQLDLAQADVRWVGAGYRLPTEAEWEKAARGGLDGMRFPWGNTIRESQANYWSTLLESFDVNGTSGPNPAAPQFPNTTPVGSFPPTGYGLYDMVGNTWVWCWDYYDDNWYSNPFASVANTRGPTSASWGGDRVYRGGSGVDNAWKCRVANRADAPPRFAMGHFGFRVVKPAGNTLSEAESAVFSIAP